MTTIRCIVAACVSFLCLVGPAAAAVADPDVGWWKFDGDAADSSANSLHGTEVGSPAYSPGIFDQALALNGANYVDCGADPILDITQQITVAAWIRMNHMNDRQPIVVKEKNNVRGIMYRVDEGVGAVHVQLYKQGWAAAADKTDLLSTFNLKANTWYHVAFTYEFVGDGTSKTRLYINGQLNNATDTTVGPLATNSESLEIGRYYWNASYHRWFSGLIDDVRIYRRALSAAEILTMALRVTARDPNPPDGATGVALQLLQWSAGDTGVFHNVYLGTSPKLGAAHLVAARQPFPMYFHAPGLEPGVTYYWRVDEVEADLKTVHVGDVWSFTTLPAAAHAPQPADGAESIPAEQLELKWAPGSNALSHEVYFGDDAAAVAAGTGNTFKGNQTATTYGPGALQQGKTYYWRVDEVGTAAKVTGPVWSFTTVPPIAVVDPALAAWWKLDEGEGTTALDWSGNNRHGTLNGSPQWVEGLFGGALDFEFDNTQDCVVVPAFDVTTRGITLVAWIRPESFPAAGDNRIIDKGTDVVAANDAWWMLSTVASGNNRFLRFRLKTDENATTTTQAATTGNLVMGEWCHAAAAWDGTSMVLYKDGAEIGRAAKGGNAVAANPAARVYIGNQLGGTQRRPWDGLIDDVRVYSKGLTPDELKEVMRGDTLPAWDPSPANGATTDAVKAATLTWQAGDKAAQHDVYLGTDQAAVKAADKSDTTGIYRGRLNKTSYSPVPAVEWGQEYVWRVDEVNSDGTITKGYLWSFKVADYLIVDDFEGYDDNVEAGTTIYDTWVDGWTNQTGSQVGHFQAPFAERTIVQGGRQSMPLNYDNTKTPYYSEAERTFDAPEDWTVGGIKTLQLQVRGRALPGSLNYDAAAQTYTMTGAGYMWGNVDAFHFAHKQLTGDGSITVRLDRIMDNPPGGDPRIGIMIRDTLDADSANALLFVEPDPRTRLTQRVRAGEAMADVAVAANVGKTPTWLRLTRQGFVFKAERSDNGTTWAPLLAAGSEASIFMTDPVYLGLVVSSHVAGRFVDATFSNVRTTGQVTPAGPFTTSQDIGIASNSPQPLYVTLKDRNNRSATVTHADLVNVGVWTAWNIPLSDFTGVNPAAVKTMIIGVGARTTPAPGGAGLVYLDNIRATK